MNVSTAPIIVVMGTSGCGKTTIGQALADRLCLPFADADDFHPPTNIQKMSSGTRSRTRIAHRGSPPSGGSSLATTSRGS